MALTAASKLSPTNKLKKKKKHSKSLQCHTAAGWTIEKTFTSFPKNSTDAFSLPNYNSSSCFSKWPNWPKSGCSGPQKESRQYQLSSQAGRAQTRLLCFISALVEQRWQELTEPLIQIDRLQEIGRRNLLFSPTHALNGVWPAVWRSCPQIIHAVKIHTELELRIVLSHFRSCASNNYCKENVEPVNWIIVFFTCEYHYLRLVPSFFIMHCTFAFRTSMNLYGSTNHELIPLSDIKCNYVFKIPKT